MKVNHRDDVSKAQTQCHPAFDDAYEVVSAFFDCISNGNDAAETIYGGHVGIVFQDLIFCVPQSRLNVLCEHSNWLYVLNGFNSYFGSWRVVENAVLGVCQGDEASSCTRASGRAAIFAQPHEMRHQDRRRERAHAAIVVYFFVTICSRLLRSDQSNWESKSLSGSCPAFWQAST